MVLNREEELRSMLRWDPEVRSLLDALKRGQLDSMAADETATCARKSAAADALRANHRRSSSMGMGRGRASSMGVQRQAQV